MKDIGGGTWKYSYEEDLEFVPGPKQIRKAVKVQWRVRSTGRRKLRKAKFRIREELDYIFNGSCESELRRKIEYFSKQEAVFLIKMSNGTDPPDIFRTPESADTHAVGNDRKYQNSTDENVFIIFDSVNFTLTEGKIGWFDYNIKFKRVSCKNVDGYLETCGTGD